MVWVGPPKQDLLKYYGAKTELGYHCLFTDNEQEVQEEFNAYVNLRVTAVGDELSFHDLLLPKEKVRLEHYLEIDARLKELGQMGSSVVRLYDLHHNPSTRPQ